MADDRVDRIGEVFSTINGDRQRSMGRWLGVDQIIEEFHSPMEIVEDQWMMVKSGGLAVCF
jgi:hypothetical protein